MDVGVRLSAALGDPPFPARRWQPIAQSQRYGADTRTQHELQALAERIYRHVAEVVANVQASEAGLGEEYLAATTRMVVPRKRPAPIPLSTRQLLAAHRQGRS